MPEASVNFGTGVSNAWSKVATFVPKFVVFLIILVTGWLIAKAIAKIVYYAIMLFVLSVAFGVFGSNPISSYLHAVIAYLPLLFVAIIIVIIAAAIAAGARSLILNSLGGLSYARLLGNLASGFILALGIIAALDQMHIAQNVVLAILYAALAAIVGIAIVAVGGGGIRTMSQRWEAAAARYDAEKPRIAAAARTAPSLREQARQAMPDDILNRPSRGATAAPAQPTQPYETYRQPDHQTYQQYHETYQQPGHETYQQPGDEPGFPPGNGI